MIKKITLIVIEIFDYFHQKKIIKFLKSQKYIFNIILDVGAHKGETINLFLKNFKLKKIISFEASKINYEHLVKKINYLKKKFSDTEIIIENKALGNKNEIREFKQMKESSSSTFSSLNMESKYLKKKKFFLGIKNNESLFISSQVKTYKLSEYLKIKKINKIDILKIDTEGFELEILKGAESSIDLFTYIFFEHHYDNMLKKKYTFSDINGYLTSKNFKIIFKAKMPFRKTFEYIYKKKIN